MAQPNPVLAPVIKTVWISLGERATGYFPWSFWNLAEVMWVEDTKAPAERDRRTFVAFCP